MPKLTDLEIETLALMLGPAVTAAIITGIVSIMISRRSARLENITAERSKWRKELRELSCDIQPKDEVKLVDALRSLKLYINAFGNQGIHKSEKKSKKQQNEQKVTPEFTPKEILQDAYIWSLIEAMEYKLRHGKIESERYLQSECYLLIDYLSLLLKFDWERAKNELNKSFTYIFGWALVITSVLGLFISVMRMDKEQIGERSYLMATVVGCGIIAISIFAEYILTIRLKEYVVSHDPMESKFAYFLVKLYPIFDMAVMYAIGWNAFILWLGGPNERLEYVMSQSISLFFCFCYLAGAILKSFDESAILNYEVDYITSVLRRYRAQG